MAHTRTTKRLEERRNSPEVQEFKDRVLTFLDSVNPPDWMRYKVLCDLSKTMDMPFYGYEKKRVGCNKSALEIAKCYVDLLIEYGDMDFARQFLTWVSRQQGQTFRRLHPISQRQRDRHDKLGHGVYEHPVPVKHSMLYLFDCIRKGNREEAHRYLEFLNGSVPQIFLSTEEDRLVNEHYKDSMPEGWNWKKDSPFIRYKIASIPESVYS